MTPWATQLSAAVGDSGRRGVSERRRETMRQERNMREKARRR